ncbi:MAG: UDP-N-acetylmuramoylalanyl-D-glutamyl-2,6-diaminopimelate/D-alanyl-D-alanyl ligase [Actinomycetia bacterium]|jgi:UDP-N-acetylmuramoyl-tripeptide--D-alanyl-D-alanine ligase|nr:UDP-N-acetylmuramoylalanyl-D-glutamyl-2,6-diaminopimelate/D-alanyl-D-alanyl ligase [Actinomycetes bacterium]
MRPRALSDVARAVEGTREGRDVEVRSVSTDSRTVGAGGLFVALPGERADGHRFVGAAIAAGAAAAMVAEAPSGSPEIGSFPLVRVSSTSEALLRLAADEREGMDATVVGITGANGKTSTKDLADAVAKTRFRVHASPGSFNNEIGLPLTLLGAPPDTQVLVAEMGARRLGDVKLLSGIARPDVVVVTNVGVAHMEVFGSWASIVEASAEPVDALGPEGLAILNADDPVAIGYADRCPGRVVTFGTRSAADVRAEDVSLDPEGRASFRMSADGAEVRVHLAVPGEHMVSNALAAAAVGRELAISLDDAAHALGEAGVSPWRMEMFTTASGVRVLNDAYNANPESTAAALRTARWIAGEDRLIAVLGEMAELGPISADEHDRVGELAARVRVDRLITVGDPARAVARAALREGMEPEDVASYVTAAEALGDVRASAGRGDLVLCKGSRIAALEAIAEALR